MRMADWRSAAGVLMLLFCCILRLIDLGNGFPQEPMTGLLTIEGEENAQNPIISTLRLDDCTSHYSSQPISLGRV